jgi:peroxiredoxin Q/BCP
LPEDSPWRSLVIVRRAFLVAFAVSWFLVEAALAISPPVGSPAPDFRLQDQNGQWHSLSDYRGRWVELYLYPKDQTPGCTTEACEFSENVFSFRDLNAVILGVSVQDVASHKRFEDWLKRERKEQVRETGLPFPLLADDRKQASAAYDVLRSIPLLGQLASRQTFIIDPQGRVAKHYSKVTAAGHSEAVLADLRTLSRPKE